MPKNEDGEFELILGNRQLLSVFFIVVILLGVFFTMGYIVGRNSSPVSADAHRPEKPTVVDSAARATPVGEASRPAETPVEPAETIRESAKESASAMPPPEAPKEEPKKPEPKPVETPKPASPLPDQPVAGKIYLQVTASAKPDAELMVDVLGKKGFRAIYAEVPEKPQIYRVLVGPLKDTAAVNQQRSDLEKAGFPGLKAIVRKF